MDPITWRCCKCAKHNRPEVVICVKCEKQRWSQIGLTAIEAIGLSELMLPKYLQRKHAHA